MAARAVERKKHLDIAVPTLPLGDCPPRAGRATSLFRHLGVGSWCSPYKADVVSAKVEARYQKPVQVSVDVSELGAKTKPSRSCFVDKRLQPGLYPFTEPTVSPPTM